MSLPSRDTEPQRAAQGIGEHMDLRRQSSSGTPHLIAELKANRTFIVSHGDYRADVVARFDEIVAAYDRAAA